MVRLQPLRTPWWTRTKVTINLGSTWMRSETPTTVTTTRLRQRPLVYDSKKSSSVSPWKSWDSVSIAATTETKSTWCTISCWNCRTWFRDFSLEHNINQELLPKKIPWKIAIKIGDSPNLLPKKISRKSVIKIGASDARVETLKEHGFRTRTWTTDTDSFFFPNKTANIVWGFFFNNIKKTKFITEKSINEGLYVKKLLSWNVFYFYNNATLTPKPSLEIRKHQQTFKRESCSIFLKK